MIEFSNQIGITLLGGASGTFWLTADSFTFEPSPTEENGGVYWDCGKTFVVDLPDQEAFRALKTPRSAIITLSSLTRTGGKCDSNEHQIGTEGIPARVQLYRHLNKATLVVKCKMLVNPLG